MPVERPITITIVGTDAATGMPIGYTPAGRRTAVPIVTPATELVLGRGPRWQDGYANEFAPDGVNDAAGRSAVAFGRAAQAWNLALVDAHNGAKVTRGTFPRPTPGQKLGALPWPSKKSWLGTLDTWMEARGVEALSKRLNRAVGASVRDGLQAVADYYSSGAAGELGQVGGEILGLVVGPSDAPVTPSSSAPPPPPSSPPPPAAGPPPVDGGALPPPAPSGWLDATFGPGTLGRVGLQFGGLVLVSATATALASKLTKGW